jgi:hypothetical protein
MRYQRGVFIRLLSWCSTLVFVFREGTFSCGTHVGQSPMQLLQDQHGTVRSWFLEAVGYDEVQVFCKFRLNSQRQDL